MTDFDTLERLGLFSARLPRYTSYPTAPVFGPAVGAAAQTALLGRVDPGTDVSLYIHVPFCHRLCWYCACRTQGVSGLGPVESYLEDLERELALVAAALPEGVRLGEMHWGGGTPTILTPPMIARLAASVERVLPRAERFRFSVEIDPTLVDADKIAALAEAGMTRASIGVQDFAPAVQAAIGRHQRFDQTALAVAQVRAAGVSSVNLDLVYGLPEQTEASLAATLRRVTFLAPDRISLFGYAHVPQIAKRQRLIDETRLPDDRARFALAGMAADYLTEHGMAPIGIDHFALPEDGLYRAAAEGRLRRNFQGYTDDRCDTLIGIGASAISRFPGGYVQNAAQTGAYAKSIRDGALAGCRGHLMSAEDRLRARAIEMLMCDFAIDLVALTREFGSIAPLAGAIETVGARYGAHLSHGARRLELKPGAEPLVRLIARHFDAYDPAVSVFSRAS
ncbi:oxygen-independent coproporphyrinogen III oxidase [Rhodobacteraceae bacterium CCMM004]|nr:oxygen-independent coproporphyrinogen III oxidase [Rhodobacteraceae bacterium CCMM004]